MAWDFVKDAFTWKGVKYDLKWDGVWKFRDAAHLGGPWTDVQRTLDNPSIHGAFKRKLRIAYEAAKLK